MASDEGIHVDYEVEMRWISFRSIVTLASREIVMASFVKMFRSDWFTNLWRSVPGSRIIGYY